MSLRVMKYNPGFATDEALKKTFVVRTHFLKWIIEILAGNIGDTNQHVLVIGPRGSGKTTLVRRVAVEIREDPKLEEQWYPIVFSEESYAITSVGEFWLEALKHLADQTKDECWQKTYEDLRRESDDRRLASRALSQLMDFADEQHKRIVLIIENLNMIFSEQLDKNADWEIRHALQNEKRLMLLGTATPHFDQIKDIQRGWFEFFAMYELEPLTTKECQTLWEALTGESLSELRIRPLQILTGGNPRLFSILAEFGAKMSLKELLDHLVELIDEYTEYFKSQLEILATTERKVFISVLEAWEPVTASQVSETSRMSTSQVSALLGRLVNRGAVTIAEPASRKKLYQASERLFNIYFLMRNRNHPSNRVKAVVDFMVQFYEEEKLLKIASKIAEEACQENLFPQDNIFAFRQILSSIKPEMRAAIIKATPREFLAIPQISSFIEDSSFSRTIDQNYNKAHSGETTLDHEALRDRLNILEQNLQVQIKSKGEDSDSVAAILNQQANLYYEQFRYEKAEPLYIHSLMIREKVLGSEHPAVATSLNNLAGLYESQGKYEEAEPLYTRSLTIREKVLGSEHPDVASSLYNLAGLYYSQRKYEEAEPLITRSLMISEKVLGSEHPAVATILNNLTGLYYRQGKYEQAEPLYLRALEMRRKFFEESHPDISKTLRSLSRLYCKQGHPKRAEALLRNSIQKGNKNPQVACDLIDALVKQDKWQEVFQELRTLLTTVTPEGDLIGSLTDIFIDIAGAGYGKEAIEILKTGEVKETLKSLIVGIQIYLGEQPIAAQEVLEIGKDVAQRIRERKKL